MAKAIEVDFSTVPEGGNFRTPRVPAGEYRAKIMKVEDAPAKSDGVAQWLFTIKLVKKPAGLYPYYIKLQANQFWKVRNLLVAAGKAVPNKRVKVNPDIVVGKEIGVVMEDDTYDGKAKSVIANVLPLSEIVEEDAPVEEEGDVEVEEEAEESSSAEVDVDEIDIDEL